MLSALVIAATLQPGASSWFANSLAAHRSMRAGSMSMELVQKAGQHSIRGKFDLAYVRPNQVKLRVREPEQNGRGASDRTYAISDGKFFAYDAVVHERIERSLPSNGTVSEKLRAIVGPIDEMIVAMIEPSRLSTFFARFQSLKGWNVKAVGNVTTLWRSDGTGKNKGTTAFRFETQSKRLKGMSLTLPSTSIDWKYTYGTAPRVIGYRPPPDAAKVTSFTERPPAPRYASAKAKAVANWAMLAYDRLRHVSLQIESEQGISKIWISSGRLREEAGAIVYVWNGSTASIKDSRRRVFYSGRAGLARLVDALAVLGTRMDPMVRQIVSRQNPVRVMFLPGVTVRHRGEMSVGGVPGDILEYRARGANVSVVIRKDNGLIASMRTEILDPQNKVATQSQRTFTYGSVGKAVDQEAFNMGSPAEYRKATIAALTK